MALDELPGEILVPTRDEAIAKWKRDHLIRATEADPADPQLDVDARVAVDSLLPVYAGCKIAGENAVLESAVGDKAVAQWGEREGVQGPLPASGGSGFIFVKASSGGTSLVVGDQLLHEPSNTTYQVARSKLYADGEKCQIAGVDTGPETNLEAGAVLKWKSPRPGCAPKATVAEANGAGLTGGRDQETPEEFKARIRRDKANRAASGNDAEYQDDTTKTPGLSIQAPFTYPSILGPGTTCVVFTMKPARPGGSRVPNEAQRAQAEAYVVGQMPGDDGAFYADLVEENADVVYKVTWDESAAGWADVVQWPLYYTGTSAITVQSAASATSFVLRRASGNYSGVTQPVIGQSIAFYDRTSGKFKQKRILSFTGTGPWTIAVDTSNGSSDTAYTPEVGQPAMPWSDSLDAIMPKLLSYFDGLGPGEQVSTFYDAGRRQRRQPQAPREWPHTLTQRGLDDALEIDEVFDGKSVEGDGITPSVGTPGVLSYVLALRWVSVFPE